MIGQLHLKKTKSSVHLFNMRVYKLIVLFIYFLVPIFAEAQDYEEALRVNPELTKNAPIKTKEDGNTIDSTFIYLTDTLTLPFFDEFSRDNFQDYPEDFNAPNTTSQLYYSLLDPATENPLPNDSVLTDSITVRLTIDLIEDTIYSEPLDPVNILYHPLTSYPVNHFSIDAYPPYIIIDTISNEPNTSDTIWLTDALLTQDSARVFISELNDNSKLWLNRQAYHNYRFAREPWSLGVVTFDGLDENGYPYLFGSTITMTCDTLFSKIIDLSNESIADSLYFSFLYQPEGYGDVPEANDSLFLDFYDVTNNQWNRVWRAGGEPNTDFQVGHIPVVDPKYFNNGFQFRFMNYGSPAGALDHFHIDYVNFRPLSGYQDTLFKDFAFVYPLSSLLSDYISVPWKHYKNSTENRMSQDVAVTVRNGSELEENNQNGTVVINYEGVQEGSYTLNATALSGGNINYEPRTTYTSYHDFSTGYTFDKTASDSMAVFDWIANASAQFPSYPQNDSTFGKQVFSNYYAYDDGSAEKAYGVFGIQSELAYQFEAYQPDSLIAVLIHFVPTVVDVSNNLFLLAVWDDNDGKPGKKIYEDEFFFPKQPKYLNGKNTFYAYYFRDKMKVAVDEKFYIGWRQIDEERLNVGFDKNHNHADKIFWSVDGGGNWNNANFEGALMMRPVVNSNLNFLLGIENPTPIEDKKDFSLYPNPTYDYLNIKFDSTQLCDIFIQDLNGRNVRSGNSNQPIFVGDLQKGIYIVTLMENSKKIGSKKLVVQ